MMNGCNKVNVTVDPKVKVTARTQTDTSTSNIIERLGRGRDCPAVGGPDGDGGAASVSVCTPTYHKTKPTRKLQDWEFRGVEPVLFLGDSNLNRIPPQHMQNIQIDSYPGANLYHFLKICEKTPTHTDTKIVVLSVGLNNRDQDPQKTSIKQLRALYRRARETFPNADVYFACINFSTFLSKAQQGNLREINDHIVANLPHLTTLHGGGFRTQPDNIHWTPETAGRVFAHWCAQLNL